MRLRLQSGRLGDLVGGRSRSHILAAAQRLAVRRLHRRRYPHPVCQPLPDRLPAQMHAVRLQPRAHQMHRMVGQHRHEQMRRHAPVKMVPDRAQPQFRLQRAEGCLHLGQFPVRAQGAFRVPVHMTGPQQVGPGRLVGCLVLRLATETHGASLARLPRNHLHSVLCRDLLVLLDQPPDLALHILQALHAAGF